MSDAAQGRPFGGRLKPTRSARYPRTGTLPQYTRERGRLTNLGRSLLLVGGLVLFCFVYGFGFALTAPYLLVPFAVPVLILALLVIWALPDTEKAPVAWISGLVYLFFIALVVWPNYLAISLPGMPWITMIRLVGFPLALALLISTSVSKGFRSEMKAVLDATPLITRLLVGFVTIQALSIALSSTPFASFQKLIVFQLSWTAVFFAAVWYFRRPGRPVLWIYTIWGLVLFTCVIGVLESRAGKILWADHIPGFLKVEDESVQRALRGSVRSAIGKHRVQARWGTPLGCAEFLALASPFVMYLVVFAKRFWIRVAALATFPVAIFVILETDSRLGLVGMLIACVIFFALWSIRRWATRRNDIIGPALTLAYPILSVMVFAATFLIGRVRNEVWGNGAQAASTASRQAQVDMGLPMILKNPFGHGVARAAEELGFRSPSGILTIDNYYLAIALDYGVLGFLVYYGLILTGIYVAVRNVLKAPGPAGTSVESTVSMPIAACLTAFFIVKSVFSQVDNHPFVFMALGALVALTFRLRQQSAQEPAAAAPALKAARRSS